MLRHIPNFITCLNLFSGGIAIILALQGDLIAASYFIFIAALLDFFDGFAARLLGAYSDIGKQLDSLADIVSFGVAPAIILYQLFILAESHGYFAYFALLVAVFGALRLARFNIDTRQTEHFIGLPIPSNALFTAGLPFIAKTDPDTYHQLVLNQPILIATVLFLCSAMISNTALLSLKFKNFSWVDNKFRFILLGMAALLLTFYNFAAFPIIIFVYIILSLINNLTLQKRKGAKQ